MQERKTDRKKRVRQKGERDRVWHEAKYAIITIAGWSLEEL